MGSSPFDSEFISNSQLHANREDYSDELAGVEVKNSVFVQTMKAVQARHTPDREKQME
jgi:hypothetical protein